VPIAAASIAQVHAARLVTGEQVVVKVQRPAIAGQVRRDLSAMGWLAPILVGRIPVASLANPPALVDVFAATIGEELDFRLEADNMLDVAAVIARSAPPGARRPLVVPRPHPQLVTRRVLVMERLTGFEWGDVAAMRAADINTAEVLSAALLAFLEGLVLFGVFHGDLHAGNLLVCVDGRVGLLDFGITGRLDERGRLGLLRLVMSTATNDVRAQVLAMRDLGALPPDADVDGVVADLRLDQPVRDPTAMDAEELTREIREMTKALLDYGARMPKALMLFVKDMLFIDHAMTTMAPDVDVLGETVAILTHLQARHGERIAQDLGLAVGSLPAVEVSGIRSSLGIGENVDRLTHRELQARRRLIRRRLSKHR
ncbi:MAG: ABC1 kinase family protein, partial [Acidimicrobiales bacterium]